MPRPHRPVPRRTHPEAVPPGHVALGEVAGVFGVRGWVRVRSDTRPPEAILDYPQWHVAGAEHECLEGRAHGPGLIVRLAGVEDRDAALALVGCTISVPRSALPDPEPGSWYWVDLIGLQVVDTRGGVIGEVRGLMETAAHDVLVIDGPEGEVLVPFVQGPIVRGVDLDGGRITVDWEDGD